MDINVRCDIQEAEALNPVQFLECRIKLQPPVGRVKSTPLTGFQQENILMVHLQAQNAM